MNEHMMTVGTKERLQNVYEIKKIDIKHGEGVGGHRAAIYSPSWKW